MLASNHLIEGDIYTRNGLRQLFDIKDATLNNGVFRPSGYQSIWLFVTEQKTSDRPQLNDQLVGNILYWDGQPEGRTDKLIIEHEMSGFELLVFYRKTRNEFPGAGFKYEGRFLYISHNGSLPTHFILKRYNATSDPIKDDVKALRLFYCYAHEDRLYRDQLDKHLTILKRQNEIISWYDREINPGADWEQEINTRLDQANIILLLTSADFIASNYCYSVEMKRALDRHQAGTARVIPIILRPHDWEHAPYGSLQVLPTDAKPVSKWPDRDEAYYDIVREIREVISELHALLNPSKEELIESINSSINSAQELNRNSHIHRFLFSMIAFLNNWLSFPKENGLVIEPNYIEQTRHIAISTINDLIQNLAVAQDSTDLNGNYLNNVLETIKDLRILEAKRLYIDGGESLTEFCRFADKICNNMKATIELIRANLLPDKAHS